MYLNIRFINGFRVVFGKRRFNKHPRLALIKRLENVFVGASRKNAQKRRHRKLSLAVNAHVDRAVRFGLNFNPHAARRDDFGAKIPLVFEFGRRKKYPERAGKLGYDNAFNAGNDEGSVRCHKRKIRHENFLLFGATKRLVLEAHRHLDRRLVSKFVVFRVVLIILRVA